MTPVNLIHDNELITKPACSEREKIERLETLTVGKNTEIRKGTAHTLLDAFKIVNTAYKVRVPND